MDLLSLRRSLWAMRGARGLGSDTDGGADTGVNGTEGGRVGAGGGGGGGGSDSTDRKGFNPAKDSQAANMGFGNEHDYAGWLAGWDAKGNPNSASMTTWAQANPKTASFFSGLASLFGGKVGGVPGSLAAKAAVGMLMSSPSLTDAQKKSASEAIGNIGEEGFQKAWGEFSLGKAPTVNDNTLQGDYRPTDGTDINTTMPVPPGGETGKTPTDPLDDLISSHFGGQTEEPDFTMPEFNADPTGLIARSNRYADEYEQQYMPYARKLMGEVDRMGSAEYMDQQRGIATAGVQQQADAQYGAAQRDAMRNGVDPSSGRMAAMGNIRAINTANAKVQAAMNSDKGLRDSYVKGLGGIQTMGADMAKVGQGFGSLGNDAAKTGASWALGSGQLGLSAAKQKQDNAVSWGGLANQKYGIDKGVAISAANNSSAEGIQDSKNLWSLAGLGLNAAKNTDWSSWFGDSSTGGSTVIPDNYEEIWF